MIIRRIESRLVMLSTKYVLPLYLVTIPNLAFAFGPCTNDFPKEISWLPNVTECGGKAAVVVFGEFYKSFSVVVRDCNNDDRDPCNKGPSSCGSNASSPYKAQSIIRAKVKQGTRVRDARLFCLKESGDSEIYKLVRRITIKLKDPVTSSKDVAKVCLKTRVRAVNKVEIISTSVSKDISSTGYSRVRAAQPYLACSVKYEDICPSY